MNDDDGRCGLRWRLRDAWRTVAFAARFRSMRYFGWGLFLLAAVMLAMLPVLGALSGETAVAAVALGGTLLVADDVTFRRRTAPRGAREDESENEDEAG